MIQFVQNHQKNWGAMDWDIFGDNKLVELLFWLIIIYSINFHYLLFADNVFHFLKTKVNHALEENQIINIEEFTIMNKEKLLDSHIRDIVTTRK